VIGGGITGAGVARDAAMRGLQVALVEQDDFASGTSGRSSRLVHGGVRYLEHGHLGLVFESSRERRTLLRIAPHLVRPLAFTWPVYEGARVPRWKLRAGLLLYDALALFRNVDRHHGLSAEAIGRREPALRPDNLMGGALYYDAATDDTRLTLANALAAAEAGAVVVNHAAVRRLVLDDGVAVGAIVQDTRTGAELAVPATVIVNAAGPWGDDVRRLAEPDARPGLLGSKGVHVAVPAERVGNRGALTLLSPIDGRVMFVLPAGRCTIVGTTETPAERGPGEVRATEADVAYLLRSVNAFFPAARLKRDDVVSAWAGIRPLAAPPDPDDASRNSASREHQLVRGATGMITASGGKLTTYRAMAAEIVDGVERALGLTPRPSPTDEVALPGGDVGALDDDILTATDATGDAEVAARLVHAHGGRWGEVWALAEREPELRGRLTPELPYLRAEFAYAVERELACTLADLLMRRTHVAYETRDAGRAAARLAAPLVAARLGWDDAAVARELEAYDADAARVFGVDP
jgi:glycerol-3-phosphate dehydrogenase